MKTAIEANELPKLIPTTGGSVDETTGASALPFGTAFVVIARDIEQERWLISKEKRKKKTRCTCALRSHVFTLDLSSLLKPHHDLQPSRIFDTAKSA